MNTHPDIMKMTRSELEAHGCELCQEGLRFQAILDKLIESQNKTIEALAKLDATVTKLERRR
jgi:hypothetical protein